MNDETKKFLVELFDVKLAENKKDIIEIFEQKFAEQDAKIDAKFAEQDARIDAKFAEQNEYIEKRFSEQNALFEAKFDELRFEVNQVVGEVLDVVTNKFKKERKKTDEKIKNKITVL